jgi:hypothetical protein
MIVGLASGLAGVEHVDTERMCLWCKSDFIVAGNSFILLLLLQRSLLPGGIILQGVLLLQGSMSVFACHYG